MLARRLRRRPNIAPALAQRPVFAGYCRIGAPPGGAVIVEWGLPNPIVIFTELSVGNLELTISWTDSRYLKKYFSVTILFVLSFKLYWILT